MNLKEFKVRLSKWAILKLLDLCRNDTNIFSQWLDDLKWKYIKNEFALFKKASTNEKVNIDYSYLYYPNIKYTKTKVTEGIFNIVKTKGRNESIVACFYNETEANTYLYKINLEKS